MCPFFSFRQFFLLFFVIISIANLFAESSGKKIYLANGFDFPVARPDAEGYYKSRGFRPTGHLGEDWVADSGGGSCFGQPVYSIGSGIVLLARDVHVAWGNVIVVRHAYLEQGKVTFADSLYAHLNRIDVKDGDIIKRGQQIGAIGNNHGMYPSHLHFEVHKNLNVGVNHTGFAKTILNYWIPTDFIIKHRNLAGSTGTAILPITHFDIPSPNSFRSLPHSSKKRISKKKYKSHSVRSS